MKKNENKAPTSDMKLAMKNIPLKPNMSSKVGKAFIWINTGKALNRGVC